MTVPKLRFPEFRDAGEWEDKKLGEIADPISERATSQDSSNALTLSAEYGIVRQGDYFGKKIAGDNVDRYIKISLNDFVYNDRITKNSTYGTIKRLSKYSSGLVSPIYKCFRFKKDQNPVFWEWYFDSKNHESQLHSIINEGARAGRFNISIQKFLSISVCLPSLPEQQKIADCLAALDDRLSAETQTIDTLKAHKKGLMQQLFPAEGETLPKLRFPEFRDAGEWKEAELSSLISYFKGFAFQSKDYTSTGRRIVRVSDMGFDYIKNETNAIYIESREAKKFEKWKLQKDDLVITTVGSKPPVYDSLVGRTIVVESKDENALLNQNAVCLRANEKIEQGFLNTLFKRSEYISFIESIIRGNANQGSIALDDLFKYRCFLPSPLEQQKITDCLGSLDETIAAQAETIALLKLHKKGLMQQLFPAVEEAKR